MPGSGVWSVRLTPESRIKLILKQLPELIKALVSHGLGRWGGHYADWGISGRSLPEPFESGLIALKVFEINYYPGIEGDWAFLSYPSPKVLATGVSDVVGWVEFLLGSEEYSDVTAKLLAVEDVDERHVLLIAGDATPYLIDGPDGWDLPNRSPSVVLGISHVWTVSRYMWRDSLLWTRDKGWEIVPALERPQIVSGE